MVPSSGTLEAPAAVRGSAPPGLDGPVLEGFLHRVLKDWMGLKAEHFADREDAGTSLPLEAMLRFSDPFAGVLVVRSVPEFASVLAAKTSCLDLDPFIVLVVRVWREMVRDLYAVEMKDVQPCRYRTSRPADWPQRAPDAASLSLVGRWPLEMRLWKGAEDLR